MTDNNATTLRNALASAIKSHVADSVLTAKDAAAKSGVQLSRLYQVLRGDVEKISSDALVNILGGFGYRLTGINGSGGGTEIVLSLDKAESQALPEIEPPSASYTLNVAEDENGVLKADGMKIVSADGSWGVSKDGEFRVTANDFSVAAEATADLTEAIDAECDRDADRVIADE